MAERFRQTLAAFSSGGHHSWSACLLLLVLCTVSLAQDSSRPLRSHVREHVAVHRGSTEAVFFPRTEDAARSGVCRALRPQDVGVRIAGRTGRVTAIDYDRRAVTHLVALDTSGSMGRSSLLQAGRVLARVWEGFRESGESVLIAPYSFDFRLLRCPALHSVEELRSCVGGWMIPDSRIWEGLYLAGRYLQTLPGQHELIVITDGRDLTGGGMSKHEVGFAADVEEILRDPNVVVSAVYPATAVGAEQPASDADDERAWRTRMLRLTERTGGTLLPSTAIFERKPWSVFERVRGRAIVYYESGAAPHRDADDGPRVRLSVRRDLGCGVQVVPPRPPADMSPRAQRFGTADLETVRHALDTLGLPSSAVTSAIHLAIKVSGAEIGARNRWLPAWAVDHPRLLLIRGPAIVVDSGLTTRWEDYSEAGAYVVGQRSATRVMERPVAVAAPPVREVHDRIHDAADAFLWLARRGVPDGREKNTWPALGNPLVLEGKTLLEWQDGIAEAFRLAFPDYRDFIAERRRAQVDEAVRRLSAGHGLGEAELAALRQSVLERGIERGLWRDWVFVGGVVEDVPLQELAREVDRRLIEAWLAQRVGRPVDRWLATQGEAIWARLTGWFPAASDVRNLALMVPTYDPRWDRIGFPRLVLPRRHIADRHASRKRLPADFVPEAPAGLRAVQAAVAKRMLGREVWRVAGVRYDGPSLDRVLVIVRLSSEAGKRGAEIRATFEREVAGDRGEFRLRLLDVGIDSGPTPAEDRSR